jgi:hypothetical protein
LIVGLDRNNDGFLDAVAYRSRCAEIELDSFLGRAPPKLPRGETPSKIPVLASAITVPMFNLEKVELRERNGAYQCFILKALKTCTSADV